jgi:hypothetical protein
VEALVIMLGVGIVWLVVRFVATRAAVARDVDMFGTDSLGLVDGLLAEQQRVIDEAIQRAAERDRQSGPGEDV